MVAIGPQGVETVGLPSQFVPTGCRLGHPVAVAVGEAVLDGVETALVPCGGGRQGRVNKGEVPRGPHTVLSRPGGRGRGDPRVQRCGRGRGGLSHPCPAPEGVGDTASCGCTCLESFVAMLVLWGKNNWPSTPSPSEIPNHFSFFKQQAVPCHCRCYSLLQEPSTPYWWNKLFFTRRKNFLQEVPLTRHVGSPDSGFS